MTYMKPELVELVSAAAAIRSTGSDGNTSFDKVSGQVESSQGGVDISTTSGAYQADE